MNPQSTVKKVKVLKKNDSLRSSVGNGRVIRNIILLTLLFRRPYWAYFPHGYDLKSTRRTTLKCNDEFHFLQISFVVVVYFLSFEIFSVNRFIYYYEEERKGWHPRTGVCNNGNLLPPADPYYLPSVTNLIQREQEVTYFRKKIYMWHYVLLHFFIDTFICTFNIYIT